jgi:hypothetical protein
MAAKLKIEKRGDEILSIAALGLVVEKENLFNY